MDLAMQPNQIVNRPDANIYVFPCHWGGITQSSTAPMIHGKLKELRRAVGSLGAKKQAGGPMFPVRSSKELMQKLAEALDELNLTAGVVNQDVTLIDTHEIPDNKTSSGKPVFRTLAHVKSVVRIGAEDGSFVDYVGSGHGGDVDDKAGGKADTYAWKAAVLKGLCIPEQNMPDTDDEEPSADTTNRGKKVAVTGGGPAGSGAKDGDGGNGAGGSVQSAAGEELEKLLLRIAKADQADLSAIVAAAKSGELALKPADKLKASAAVVKRSKELAAENATDKS